MTAKEFNILGTKVYIYRRVCDELEMPSDNKFRFKFHRENNIGEWGSDKLVVNEIEINKEIQGDDYKHSPNGYMYITENMKQELEIAFIEWKRNQ